MRLLAATNVGVEWCPLGFSPLPNIGYIDSNVADPRLPWRFREIFPLVGISGRLGTEKAIDQSSRESPVVDEAATVAVPAITRHLGVIAGRHEDGIGDRYLLISARQRRSAVLAGRTVTVEAVVTKGASIAAVYK